MSQPDIAYRSAPRHRATAILLTLAVHIFIVMLVLLQPSWTPSVRDMRRTLVTFQLLPEPKPEPERVARVAPEKQARQEPQPVPIPVETPTPPPVIPQIVVTPTPPIETPPPAPAADAGHDTVPAVAAKGPSQAADWYRRPTTDQLAPYMPVGRTVVGNAAIQCLTAPNYHVRNCRILDETPVGSGLAHAMQRASGQFRVRPPMIDGHPAIGAWVTIRIELMPPSRG